MANEKKSEILHQLQIENDNKKKLTAAKKDGEQQQRDNHQEEDSLELEYKTLSVELEQLQALFQQITERKKNIQLISDQVQGWTNRVAGKLAGQLNDNSFRPRAPLLQKFQWVNGIINQELTAIVAEQKAKHRAEGESDDESINARDFINDFSNEEFLNKNIRVRPVSGRSAGRHPDDNKSDHSKHNVLGSSLDDFDNEKKFNADVQHDITSDRMRIKLERQKVEDALIAAAEKAEKKKKLKVS